jgi:hyperosmotically inducible protein
MSAESRIGRATAGAALMVATLVLSGCALAMLNGAAHSGGAAAPASGTAARQSADAALATSVRSKLAANPALKPFNLGVDTHDGVVTLTGQVATVEQRNAAQLAARSVNGVKSVQNRVTVR